MIEREARVVPKIQATTMEYTLRGIVKTIWQNLSSLAPRGLHAFFSQAKQLINKYHSNHSSIHGQCCPEWVVVHDRGLKVLGVL